MDERRHPKTKIIRRKIQSRKLPINAHDLFPTIRQVDEEFRPDNYIRSNHTRVDLNILIDHEEDEDKDEYEDFAGSPGRKHSKQRSMWHQWHLLWAPFWYLQILVGAYAYHGLQQDENSEWQILCGTYEYF